MRKSDIIIIERDKFLDTLDAVQLRTINNVEKHFAGAFIAAYALPLIKAFPRNYTFVASIYDEFPELKEKGGASETWYSVLSDIEFAIELIGRDQYACSFTADEKERYDRGKKYFGIFLDALWY